MTAAVYCRVSTDRADQANSFESQQRYFRDYIARQDGWTLYDVYADEETGTSTKKRAAFNRMIADARAGRFQRILTKEVSRFSRNILDTIAYTRELRGMGVAVVFLTDGICTTDPDAEMKLGLMASMAQEESRRTSARVKWGQARQMERGVVFGTSMLGYDVTDGKLSVEPVGAETVRLIFHKYAVEGMSASAVARMLRKQGISTHRGGTNWTAGGILRILRNEKYVGDLVQRKTYTPDFLTHEKKPNRGAVELIVLRDHHPPLISRALWDAAQVRLSEHRSTGGGTPRRCVCSGRIVCGECGAGFVARQKRRSDGSVYRRWACRSAVNAGRAECSIGRLLRDDTALEMIALAVGSLQLDRNAIIRRVTALAMDAIRGDTEDDPTRLLREIERVKRKKEDMMDAFFSGTLTQEEMQGLRTRYDTRLGSLDERLRRAAAADIDRDAQRQEIERTLASLLSGESQSDVLYRTILGQITVYKDRTLALSLRSLPQVWTFGE